jgi:hypothetical protein
LQNTLRAIIASRELPQSQLSPGSFAIGSTDYDFFRMLHAGGRRAAWRFLDEHFDDIGRRSTFDLRAEAQAEWA